MIMVLIEPSKPADLNSNISELSDFDDELKELPELPEFKDDKEAKSYANKLWANKTQERINALLKFKKRHDKKRGDVEREVLYREGILSRLWNVLFNKQYASIGIVHGTGQLKFFKRSVKNQTVKIKKALYVVRKPELLYMKGKPTLIYFEGNPQPITFDNENHRVLVTSESLYHLWQARFVNQLFSGMDTKAALMWGTGTLIALGVVAYFIVSAIGQSTGNTIEPVFLMVPWNYFNRRFLKNG